MRADGFRSYLGCPNHNNCPIKDECVAAGDCVISHARRTIIDANLRAKVDPRIVALSDEVERLTDENDTLRSRLEAARGQVDDMLGQLVRAEESQPTLKHLVHDLRGALGMFNGAMPISPKEAWEEAIAKVQALMGKIEARDHQIEDLRKDNYALERRPARTMLRCPGCDSKLEVDVCFEMTVVDE